VLGEKILEKPPPHDGVENRRFSLRSPGTTSGSIDYANICIDQKTVRRSRPRVAGRPRQAAPDTARRRYQALASREQIAPGCGSTARNRFAARRPPPKAAELEPAQKARPARRSPASKARSGGKNRSGKTRRWSIGNVVNTPGPNAVDGNV